MPVNGVAETFMKRKFTEWYSCCISAQLHVGRDIEDVEVQLKLSILRPLKAK